MNELKEPEKTSAWTEEEREKVDTSTAPRGIKIEAPAWAADFAFGDVLTHNGWEAVVRHVGEGAPGSWFVMLEPLRRIETKPSRAMKRAEFRRLKHTIGKRKAKEVLRARSSPA